MFLLSVTHEKSHNNQLRVDLVYGDPAVLSSAEKSPPFAALFFFSSTPPTCDFHVHIKIKKYYIEEEEGVLDYYYSLRGWSIAPILHITSVLLYWNINTIISKSNPHCWEGKKANKTNEKAMRRRSAYFMALGIDINLCGTSDNFELSKTPIDVFHCLIGGVAPKRSEIHLLKKQH